MQLSLGLPDPRDQSSLPRLKRVLAGISRARLNQHRHPPRIRLPIMGHLLAKIHTSLAESSNPDKVLIWAICSLAFFVFFRLGELLVEAADQYRQTSSLSWGDVAVDSIASPTILKVHLKRSKCDQFGKGVDVVVGRTRSPICPVTAVLEYIRVCQNEPGLFFVSRAKAPVTKAWLVQQAGMSSDPSASPRRTMRVTASASGQPRPPRSPGSRIPQYRHWADGRVRHSSGTSGYPGSNWPTSPPGYREQPCNHNPSRGEGLPS